MGAHIGGTLEPATGTAAGVSTYSPAVAPLSGSRPAIAVPIRQANGARRERRSGHRYPVDLLIEYELGRAGKGHPSGQGRVVNMSSSGILIRSDRMLIANQPIRLRINWPALLNDVVPLALRVEGVTVRVDGDLTALKILKSEFRTRPAVQTAVAAHA